MGYRFRVNKFKELANVKRGSKINVDLSFVNEGLTPAYNDYKVAVALIPEGAASIADNAGFGTAAFASTTLMPGSALNISVPMTINANASGKYTVVAAVVDNDNKPCMNLGMAGKLFDKVYVLGTVEVK